jgi:hypothetical protein
MQKHQEQSAEQELIGDWVKVLSQNRSLLEPSRQQAIKRVGESGGDKENEA